MKIRIQKDNLRFRLQPEDLDLLKTTKTCSESVIVSPSLTLEFKIVLSATRLSRLHTTEGQIQIEVPDHTFLDWLEGNHDEWDFTQAHPRLDIFVEKDLKPRRPN